MEANFLITNNTIAYVIHGQPLCLQFKTTGCWFVVIVYDDGKSFKQRFLEKLFLRKPNTKYNYRRRFYRKANGKFDTVTNYYSPEISVWGVGWGIKQLFHKRLKINFFNPITQTIRAHTPELPDMPDFSVRSPKIQVHQQHVRVKSASSPRLLNADLNITAYDDYSNYKSNYHSNNTIN